MSKNEPNNNSGNDKPMNSYAKYSGLAFQMIAIIGLFTFIGYKIDDSAGHAIKWVTAIFSLVGVFISLFIVIRSLKS